MRSTKRSTRSGNGGTPPRTVTYTALGLACLFLLAMAVHLPASSSSNSVSLDASFVHRSSVVAGQRELLDVKEDTASSGRSFLQYQTRRNWAAEDVSPQFCGYDDATQKCDWSNYAQSLSLLATPPAVIGIFFFIFYIVIFLVRCCCINARCCMLPWTGSSLEPWIMRILLLSIAVMILGMAVMAHVGNAWAHEGVNDLSDDSATFAKTIVNLTTEAADLLVQLDSSQQGTADSAKSDASDVQKNIDDFKDVLDKVETARFVVFLFTFIIIFGIGISALFSICCFRRPTFCANYCYALALFVPIIVVMTFCIVFGAASSDVCTAYDDAKHNSTNNLFSEILGSSWGVDCAALQDLINPLLNESDSTINKLCTQYNQTCASDSAVSGCQPCSTTANIDLLKQTNYTETLRCNDSPNVCPAANQTVCNSDPNSNTICYQQTLTFEACVTECLSSNARDVANQTIYYVDLYDEINSTITDILPYVGCGLITQFVEATDYGLCVEFIAGDFLVVVATIVLGFLWIFYEFVVLLAFERAGFQPDKDDDYGL